MSRRVAVVTDSTAYLPPELIARHRITVVPLHVTIDGVPGREGVDALPVAVARSIGSRRYTVTTSRPAPAEFAEAYRRALDDGADAVVSVHLSGELSGTCDAATLAAAETDGEVVVLDSRSTVMGLGFAVLAAVEAADAGGGVDAVRAAALGSIARTTALFCVDTLEHLRRGGRIGAAAALVGVTLAVKPILHMADGAIVVREKVRTLSRALARLEDLAAAAAGTAGADLAVHHLAAPERAEVLRARLTARIPDLGRVVVSEVGAVVGAHVGPGAVAVIVVPHG